MGNGDAPRIKILRDREVYANEYGSLHDDDVEFQPLGIKGRYVRWKWDAPYSIAVLPIIDRRTALLIRNFRHSARREVLEAVKGFGDEGRTPAMVAAAELREEAGFRADDLSFIGTTEADPAFASHPMHCFIGYGAVTQDNAPESSEAIAGAQQFQLERTPTALMTGEIQDAVTLLLLWQAWQVLTAGGNDANLKLTLCHAG